MSAGLLRSTQAFGQSSLAVAKQAAAHSLSRSQPCLIRHAHSELLLTLAPASKHWTTIFIIASNDQPASDRDLITSTLHFSSIAKVASHKFMAPSSSCYPFLPFDDADPWPTPFSSFFEVSIDDKSETDSLYSLLSDCNQAPVDTQWLDSNDFFSRYAAAQLNVDPVALRTIRQAFDRLDPRCQQLFELGPDLFAAAIPSPTLPPFTRTNTLLLLATTPRISSVEDEQCAFNSPAVVDCCWALVDPGSDSPKDLDQLAATLSQLHPDSDALPPPLAVVTHHHLDHLAGLPELKKHFPRLRLGGHPDILPLLDPSIRALVEFVPLVDGSSIRVLSSSSPSRVWQVVHSPGHTKTHIAIWHSPSRTLLAGDHIVGRGSAVLDSCSGGDMSDYLATCRLFIDLQPRCIIPAHGNPSYEPRALLEQYISHRIEREAQILACCKAIGSENPGDIVRTVYANVPEQLWPAAEKNISLHLKKLRIDGKL